LSWCFDQISDLTTLWKLFLLNHNLINLLAELTVPVFVVIYGAQLAELVEDSFASAAQKGITCRHLRAISQAIELDLGYIDVIFLLKSANILLRGTIVLFHLSFDLFLLAEASSIQFSLVLIVAQVQITIKVIVI
jgi:hypothetical protein